MAAPAESDGPLHVSIAVMGGAVFYFIIVGRLERALIRHGI